MAMNDGYNLGLLNLILWVVVFAIFWPFLLAAKIADVYWWMRDKIKGAA